MNHDPTHFDESYGDSSYTGANNGNNAPSFPTRQPFQNQHYARSQQQQESTQNNQTQPTSLYKQVQVGKPVADVSTPRGLKMTSHSELDLIRQKGSELMSGVSMNDASRCNIGKGYSLVKHEPFVGGGSAVQRMTSPGSGIAVEDPIERASKGLG